MSFLKKNGKLAGAILALASTLLLQGVTPAFALSQGDLVSGGSIWLETTIAVAMVFVTAMAFSLQIARGYFLRILDKFTLRLGADIWWLAYVLIRDALIFLSFVMGLMVFLPGTFEDYALAVPFMPLSVVFFGAALITKLYFDADENRNAFRAVTFMVGGGTFLWIFGTVFITESPLQLANPALTNAPAFFTYLYNTFNAQANPDLAMNTFYATFAALGVVALLGFAHPILNSRVGGKKGLNASPQGQGPASPATIPMRATTAQPREQLQPSRVTQDFHQASISPRRETVDYIA